MACLFKKGDDSLCSNFPPISLLSVGYKVFAALLLGRLMNSGVEQRLSSTQRGFRAGRGTRDALFVARRLIDSAATSKDFGLMYTALDWAKDFDSIQPAAMLQGLRRFGLPEKIIKVVAAIYKERRFFVQGAGATSGIKAQMSGISQGCPLSPYLFVIVMSVLMHDARNLMQEGSAQLADGVICHELVYADDTLLIDVAGQRSTNMHNVLQSVA